MSGIMFEPAGPGDIDELEMLELRCFPEEPWSRKMLLEEIENECALFVVAREHGGSGGTDADTAGGKENADAGRIIGYMIAWMIPPYECQIGSIAVLPECRRQGIAEELLRILLEVCAANRIEDVLLEVRVSNAAAIGLYRKFGFRVTGVRKRYYQNGEDAYNMARSGK